MIKKILIIIISSLLLLGLSIGVGYALAPQIFNPLPITSDFYDIDSKGVVQGFAPQFLAAADTKEHAESYVKQRAKKTANVLDLHSQKITGTQYAFSYFKDSNENINNIFAMFIKIDLSDT
jgi:hypothetical protein